MTNDFAGALVRDVALVPLAGLPEYVEALQADHPDTALREVEERAEGLRVLAMRAAERAVYLDQIALNMTHDRAVARVNKVQSGLAKLFGYSYPKSHEVKF